MRPAMPADRHRAARRSRGIRQRNAAKIDRRVFHAPGQSRCLLEQFADGNVSRTSGCDAFLSIWLKRRPRLDDIVPERLWQTTIAVERLFASEPLVRIRNMCRSVRARRPTAHRSAVIWRIGNLGRVRCVNGMRRPHRRRSKAIDSRRCKFMRPRLGAAEGIQLAHDVHVDEMFRRRPRTCIQRV